MGWPLPPSLCLGKKGSESRESVFLTQTATHGEFTPTAGKYFSHLEKLGLCDATEGSAKKSELAFSQGHPLRSSL